MEASQQGRQVYGGLAWLLRRPVSPYGGPLVVPMAISQRPGYPVASCPLVVPSSSVVTASDCSCAICLETAVEPLHTRCAHLFCRRCLGAAMQHDERCPLCRAPGACPELAAGAPFAAHRAEHTGLCAPPWSLASVSESSGGRLVRCADRSGRRRDSRVDLATKTPRDDEVGARAFGVECQQEVVSRGEGATLRAEGAALTGTVRR